MDDFAISGPGYLPRLIGLMEKIIRQEGFFINEKKRLVMKGKESKETVGIRIHKLLDIPPRKIREASRLIDELAARINEGIPIREKEIQSIEGKILWVERLNRGAGRSLRRKLTKVRSEII